MTDRKQTYGGRRRVTAILAVTLLPLSSVVHAQNGAAGAAAGNAGNAAAPAAAAPAAAAPGVAAPAAAEPAPAAPAVAAPAPAAPAATVPGLNAAPATAGGAGNGAAPAVATPAAPVNAATPAPPPATTTDEGTPGTVRLSLDQVVTQIMNNNSAVQLAEERYRRSGFVIDQAYAQARPSVRVNITDTQTSYKTFSAGGGSVSSGVSLPGGGAIPTITDSGGGTNAGLTAGGGGGTAPISTNSAGFTNTGGTGVNGGTVAPTVGGTAPATNNGGAGAAGNGGGGGAVAAPNARAGAISTPENVQQVAHSLLHSNATSGDGTTNNGGGSTGHYNNAGGSLVVTQPIDLFGYVRSGIDVERRTHDFYAIDLERTKNETALSAKTAFYSLLQARANVSVYQEQVTADTENVRIATAKFNAGTSPRYDVLTAQTQLANDQQLLISAQDQLNIATANLNSAIGQPLDTIIDAVEPALPPLDQTIDIQANVQRAYKNRPELRQADNNIEIAKKLIKIAGAGLSPSLGLTGTADYSQYASNGPHDTYSLSATLSVPLYDGGETKALVRSAQSDLRTQEITRGQLRQNAALEVRQAALNANDARARASAASTSVASAEEAYRLSQLRFQNGLGTFVEVTTSAAQLATARTNLSTAQYDYQTSLAQLLRATGGR